jgi:AcrR family transcriptional regulator
VTFLEKLTMTFGKLGRPPEDRLACQLEIFEAVAPLLLAVGVRRLSMRQAARAAHLSIGGLYYYFPTKHDLALFAIQPQALARRCQDFNQAFGHLATSDPQAFLDAFCQRFAENLVFGRPSARAALELGVDVFTTGLEAAIQRALGEFVEGLRLAAPQASEERLRLLARSLRRVALTAVLEGTETSQAILDEFRLLVESVRSGETARSFV